ncbi:MAG: hypothetical protein HN867_09685 [Deltaproteobacteria bacterium]|jgi:hypothetical protein|nr:hypothetical protein [Deltaproteobacteria bacterium]MBT7203744.1 hypothetical protein [Deltaproteobacteria bacterium]
MNLKKTVPYLSILLLLLSIAGCASNNLGTCTIGPLHFHYGEQEQLSQVCYRDTPQNFSAQKIVCYNEVRGNVCDEYSTRDAQ